MHLRRHLTFEVLIRVAADLVIVNAVYLMALTARLLWKIVTEPHLSAPEQVRQAGEIYLWTFWLLSLISIGVYAAAGFYTRGRFYRGRLKALVIFQSVSLAYLLFTLAVFYALGRSVLPQPPRLALLLAWFGTASLTIIARLWASLWRRVMKRESPLLRAAERGDDIQHVLVIGGAGYIGSILCRQLLERGYSVRVLDALLYGSESIDELKGHPRFELVEGDSRDVCAVFRAMLDMDAVVHLGELVGDPACALDERLTLEINLSATRMVAEAARGYGAKRFIYASSCSVYGAGDDFLDERSRLSPVSLYARAKIGSERALLALNGPDFHPVILRFATVYGLSYRPRFDLVINLLTAKAVRDGEITIFGGDQWRPFVHVTDVARAIGRCLEAPLDRVTGQVFNVGSDEQNYTLAQVGDLIQRLVPTARLVTQSKDGDRRDYHVSFAKIKREIGFVPARRVEQGVRELQVALLNGRIIDYRDKRYSNYKTLCDERNHAAIRSRHINELYAPPGLPEGAVAGAISAVR